jgi:large subunit ribosomal protein L23
MKEPYTIVLNPVISEKGTRLTDEQNKYLFRVDAAANKIEIKRAIEQIYKVQVAAVNTMTVHGKIKRFRNTRGRTPDWKKAVITLKEGESISFI